jgi:signal peptidase II
MIFIIILLSVFLGDLMLKKYVEARLAEGEERLLFGGKICVRKVHNAGIAFGGLSEYPELIRKGTLGFIGIFLLYFILLLRHRGSTGKKLGLSLLLGGALCNWYDRFHQGHVTDYFSFQGKCKKLRDLFFNLSDLCIFVGIFLTLFGRRDR